MVLYTHDMGRNVTYMSDSATSVCDLSFSLWKRRNFELMFTDHPWNEYYRNLSDQDLVPNQIQLVRCEIFGDSGKRIQLEVRRQIILFEGALVGVIGIARKLPSVLSYFRAAESMLQTSLDGPSLMGLWNSLTQAERDVVGLVVSGDMNKVIARKLEIAERTVESRRSREMKKLGLESLPDLVRYHLLVQQWQQSQEVVTDNTSCLD